MNPIVAKTNDDIPLNKLYGLGVPGRINQGIARKIPVPGPVALTFRQIRPRLNLLLIRPEGRQAYWDLEHRRLPRETEYERTRTFLGLVRLAHRMGVHGNIQVQTGLKDLMTMLGYRGPERFHQDIPQAGNPDRQRLFRYLATLNGWKP